MITKLANKEFSKHKLQDRFNKHAYQWKNYFGTK